MYAKLTGTIADIFPNFLILDVSGVGYRIETVMEGFLVDQEVTFYIYTFVRENDIRLFGMSNKNQYQLFMDLIEISGVGPKVALIILSQLEYHTILSAIESKNIQALKVKGVGNKIAQRIIIEMFPKLEKYHWQASSDLAIYAEEFILETREALSDLGFNNKEIEQVLKDYATQDMPQTLESIIKFALKYIRNK